MLKKLLYQFSQNRFLVLLLFLGTITWSLTMVKSGWVYEYGMGFWGPNGHDGVWHIALAESLSRGSFDMPVFSGETLKNYHIGFDLILAFLGRITGIPIRNLYFQIIPPILALFIGVLTYKFTHLWTKSKNASLWSVFFVYFSGGFGYFLGKGESAFWAQGAISTLINPPFALSLVFILLGLILLIKDKKILSIIFFGFLIEIKVYAGALVLAALLVSGVFEFIRSKKLNFLKVFVGSLLVSLILFLSLNKVSPGLLVWQPLWFLESMLGPDRLNWSRFYSAITTYRMGEIWIKAIPAYLLAFAIFWIGNMGTRMTKELLVFKWLKNIKEITWIEVFISVVIVLGGIVPTLFLQKGTSWNTIQFFYYSLFFSGILAGVTLSQLKNKILIYLIVLLTIPTTIITLKEVYVPGRPPAKLSIGELEALNFLSTQPNGVVLTHPFDRQKAKEAVVNPPRPLYLYESTAYVSGFSGKSVFLEDEVNLDITGYEWQTRRKEVESFFAEKDIEQVKEFLVKNNIKYIYLTAEQEAFLPVGQLELNKVFQNKEVSVFMVKS